MKTLKRFITLLTCLGFCTVFAQMSSSNPIVGTWQTTVELGQGLAPATGIFQAQADGRYREEMYIQGQLAAFWEGQYSLSPDGTLTQQESNKSPQICMQGQCMANDGPTTTLSRVSVQGPDTFVVSLQDPSSGQMFSITWQRQNTQPVIPAPNPLSQVNPQQHSIVGSWQFVERTPQGHTVLALLTYTPDGRFDIRRLLNGQTLMVSYGGTYTLDPNGNLTETTTEKSPQFCYLQCQPNSAQLGTSAPMQISFADANTLMYAGLRFQRAQAGAPGEMPSPTPSMPGLDGGNTGSVDGYPAVDGYPTSDNGGFVDGVIWGKSPFQNPNGDGTFLLPDSPDPSTIYYGPSGNPLNYNDVTNTWTEVDSYGFETEISPAGE
jgi:hypothetical protein